MNKFKIVLLILVSILLFVMLLIENKSTENEGKKKVVSVSNFYIYDITKHIAKDKLKVVNILPFGTDPHSFEPTPKLMTNIEKSSLVLLSGAGLEPWVDTMEFKTKVVDMSKFMKLRELGKHEFEFHTHHDEQCAHNKIDPHYWLNFSNMRKATILITDELTSLEPKNRDFFYKNRDAYLKMLQTLEKHYKEKLSSCQLDTVILNHNALGYLAEQFHFHADSLSGLSPEANPTPDDIKRVFNSIKAHGASTIFFENFVNNKMMQTIAKDAKVNIDSIEPLGNITADEAKANATYETIMYKNLEKLSKALMCN